MPSLDERRSDLRLFNEQAEILTLLRKYESEGMSRRAASKRAVDDVNDPRREPNPQFRRFLLDQLRKDV